MLIQDFEVWCRQNVWLNFETEGPKYFASLARKRGNPPYILQMREKLDRLSMVIEPFVHIGEHETNAIFFTATYARRGKVQNAWKNVGKDWNRCIAALRKRYGRIQVVRSWQSHEDGWPHVHALLLFENVDFKSKPVWSDEEERLIDRPIGTKTWRRYWRKGFTDERSCTSSQGAAWYLCRELLKYSSEISVDTEEARRTQALLWVNRKRSFSISQDLGSALRGFDATIEESGLDAAMRNSNRFGLPPGAKFRFLGVSRSLGKLEPGQKEGQWCYAIERPPLDLHIREPPPPKPKRPPSGKLRPRTLHVEIVPAYVLGKNGVLIPYDSGYRDIEWDDEVSPETRARISRLWGVPS